MWSGSGRRPGYVSTGAVSSSTPAGLTIAAFRQTTSRADDPQIHTHAVISAKVSTAGWAVVGVGRPVPETQAADDRRDLPVGAARRTRPPLRGRLGAGRERPGRDRRHTTRAARGVLETGRRGRSRARAQGRRVPGPAGSRPDPLGTRRVDPRSRGRHAGPQVRQRCRRSAVTVAGRSRRRSAGTRRRSSTSCSPPAEPSPPSSPADGGRGGRCVVGGRVDVDPGGGDAHDL